MDAGRVASPICGESRDMFNSQDISKTCVAGTHPSCSNRSGAAHERRNLQMCSKHVGSSSAPKVEWTKKRRCVLINIHTEMLYQSSNCLQVSRVRGTRPSKFRLKSSPSSSFRTWPGTKKSRFTGVTELRVRDIGIPKTNLATWFEP